MPNTQFGGAGGGEAKRRDAFPPRRVRDGEAGWKTLHDLNRSNSCFDLRHLRTQGEGVGEAASCRIYSRLGLELKQRRVTVIDLAYVMPTRLYVSMRPDDLAVWNGVITVPGDAGNG